MSRLGPASPARRRWSSPRSLRRTPTSLQRRLGQPDLVGAHTILSAAVANLDHAARAGDRQLVEAVLGSDDQGMVTAERGQRLGDRLLIAAVGDPEQLPGGAGRVGQRPEEVEDRADAELLADRDDVLHSGVVGRGEHEAERSPRRSARPAPGQLDSNPERLEEVGGADRDVLERLPCLATAQPAPAAIRAAVVETLKVEGPPPVPAVSTRPLRSISTGAASGASSAPGRRSRERSPPWPAGRSGTRPFGPARPGPP